MSNFNVEIINADNEDGLIGLVINGTPYMFWLFIYKSLGLSPQHARKILLSLEEGKHYVSFSKSKLNEICDTLNVTFIPNVSRAYFLTEEGLNRAIMEIETSRMDNQEIANKINDLKNQMAHIFARYQRGEILSLALDKANIDPTAISGKAAIIVSDCFDIAKAINEHFGVDKTVATVHLLNGYKPEMIQAGHSGNIEPIVQLLPISVDEDEAYLTATAIGDIVGLSNRTVNKTLKEWGYHIEKTRIGSSGKMKPDGWKPTTKGFPEGGWKINSDGHNGGKLYVGVQWRWKASILKVFEERMGLTLNTGQSKLIEEGRQ